MFAGDRVALRGRLRVDLPTEVARTTIVPASPGFMATHPSWSWSCRVRIGKSIWFKRGSTVYCDLVPSGTETLIARPLGLLRMVNAASPAYLARYGVPRSLEDLQRQEHRTIHFSTMLGARPIQSEISGRRQLRDASVARCATRQHGAQTYDAAALAGLGLSAGRRPGDPTECDTAGRITRFFPAAETIGSAAEEGLPLRLPFLETPPYVEAMAFDAI